MSKLILIAGLPGVGKTTLARELSKKLNIVCLSKDDIKEALYDILGKKTLQDSIALGRHSTAMLYELAELQMQNEVDLILESPFYYLDDYALFRKWEEQYNIELITILCHIDEDIRVKRLTERPRHHAHHDHERDHTPADDSVYADLPGKIINLKTDRTVPELADSLATQLQ